MNWHVAGRKQMKIETRRSKGTTLHILSLALLLGLQSNSARAATQNMSVADRLSAIEEIHQLKARYIRCMDTKDWICWEGVFAPDFHFKAGNIEWHSAKEMVQSTHLTGLFDRVKTVSHAYTPEIEILSPTTARGTWAVDFLHYWPVGTGTPQGNEIAAPGTWNHTDGYYHDTYVKIGGKWFIKSEQIESSRETEGSLTK
jgi:hypothetical protein